MISINGHNGILQHGDKDTQLTANSGNIYLRPYGYNNTNNQIIITPTALQGKVQIVPRSVSGNDNAGGAGWYKICSHTISGYGNDHLVLMITDDYAQKSFGILNIEIRGNNGSLSCWDLRWICRGTGILYNDARIAISGTTWTLYINRHTDQYGRLTATELINHNINGNITDITYYSSSTKESTAPTASTTSYDGMLNAYPITLYDNTSGTTGTVTLNETAANFSYLEVFAGREDRYYSTRIVNPNNKKVQLVTSYCDTSNNHFYTYSKLVKVSGTSLTVEHSKLLYHSGSSYGTIGGDDSHKIFRVVGYR